MEGAIDAASRCGNAIAGAQGFPRKEEWIRNVVFLACDVERSGA
jgi:hypothetical protein